MIAYIDRKDAIRADLILCAQEGRTIFYNELGRRLDIPARGPWKGVLDEIAREEVQKGLPDITFLVISMKTGLPGQIGFKPANPPTPQQRQMADDTIQKVFAYYRPKTGP
jgi:hypothetical protein